MQFFFKRSTAGHKCLAAFDHHGRDKAAKLAQMLPQQLQEQARRRCRKNWPTRPGSVDRNVLRHGRMSGWPGAGITGVGRCDQEGTDIFWRRSCSRLRTSMKLPVTGSFAVLWSDWSRPMALARYPKFFC